MYIQKVWDQVGCSQADGEQQLLPKSPKKALPFPWPWPRKGYVNLLSLTRERGFVSSHGSEALGSFSLTHAPPKLPLPLLPTTQSPGTLHVLGHCTSRNIACPGTLHVLEPTKATVHLLCLQPLARETEKSEVLTHWRKVTALNSSGKGAQWTPNLFSY